MQGAQQETTAHSLGQLDTPSALWLLGSLAGFYRRPFDAALVLQRFAPPFDFPSLIEALEALGLKAGLAEWPQDCRRAFKSTQRYALNFTQGL